MADTSTTDETAAASKNDASVPSTPPLEVKAEDTSAVEKMKQELQATMRANQVANEKLKVLEQEKADREAKELEDNQEYKTLAEQEKAKREALEAQIAEREKTESLDKAKTQVLSGYSDEVKGLAEEVGLTLTDTDDASVQAFKDKLDKINTRVVTTGKVGPNNNQPSNNTPELSSEELQEQLHDEKKFHEIVTERFPGIKAMTTPKK